LTVIKASRVDRRASAVHAATDLVPVMRRAFLIKTMKLMTVMAGTRAPDDNQPYEIDERNNDNQPYEIDERNR
jgi:hypothetical protein